VNDLHYIFYQPKLMYLDTSDMSCAGERAHRRAIDYTWFNDGPPLNQKRILLQITMTAEAEWPEVKRELMRKGWIEAGEYFLHRGAIKSLNESKEKYVANHNRQAKMNIRIFWGSPFRTPSRASSRLSSRCPPRLASREAIRIR
jgi:hypothetical protein